MNKGKCFGVSVGPGDPQLITIKAINTLIKSDVIFLPSSPKEDCKVYQILRSASEEEEGSNDFSKLSLDEKKIVCIDTKGMADLREQTKRHDILAKEVENLLDKGLTVAFPALGEVCLYSTYFYVHERLLLHGYESELISGISSVQETANRMNISLAQGDEEVHIFPDTKDLVKKLNMPGTKVFMKPTIDNLSEIVGIIKEYVKDNKNTRAYGISNCGRENEITASSSDELDKLAGYMTVIIVKQLNL